MGDGQLIHSGAEYILETYYNVAVFTFAKLSLDYQFVDHPAYNGLPAAFPKWTCELPMKRAWSGRRGFEADLNRFTLMPQAQRT